MRRCGALLLLMAAAAAAQDPFAPLDAKFRPGVAVPGAKGRVGEEMAQLKLAIERNPADIDALERAVPVLTRVGRIQVLWPVVDRAFDSHELSDRDHARLQALRGRLYMQRAAKLPAIQLPPGLRQADLERLEEALKNSSAPVLKQAVADLRAAAKVLRDDYRCREDLAKALTLLRDRAAADEIKRLRTEAIGLRMRAHQEVPPVFDLSGEVMELRQQAESLEQVQDKPRHDDALILRKRALIMEFCTHTIPFTAKAELWEAVALLAPERMVQENLTRTFKTKSGEISSVTVQYYNPPSAKRVEVVDALGKDDSDNAAAVLLGVLRRVRGEDPVAQAILAGAPAAFQGAKRKAVLDHLPRLLATALFTTDETEFPRYGRRMLVQLTGTLQLKEAAPVLRKALEKDDDLFLPLGVATALGRIGDAEDAALLLAAARDRRRPIHFRREAAYWLGALDQEKLAGLDDVPLLEIAVAAARYRAQPSQDSLGRILNGLDRLHEADDAAHYCAELGIREALGAMDTFLNERADHYAVDSVRRSHARLSARLRDDR